MLAWNPLFDPPGRRLRSIIYTANRFSSYSIYYGSSDESATIEDILEEYQLRNVVIVFMYVSIYAYLITQSI